MLTKLYKSMKIVYLKKSKLYFILEINYTYRQLNVSLCSLELLWLSLAWVKNILTCTFILLKCSRSLHKKLSIGKNLALTDSRNLQKSISESLTSGENECHISQNHPPYLIHKKGIDGFFNYALKYWISSQNPYQDRRPYPNPFTIYSSQSNKLLQVRPCTWMGIDLRITILKFHEGYKSKIV